MPISAKNGIGIGRPWEHCIVTALPAGDLTHRCKPSSSTLRYRYRGVILLCRVQEGTLRRGDSIRFMHSNRDFKVEELGYNQLTLSKQDCLKAGEVGYVIAGIKTIREIAIGDTITTTANPAESPLPGFKPAKPVVFSSIYPMTTDGYQDLSTALEKLSVNDAALVYEKDSSAALGFGFR